MHFEYPDNAPPVDSTAALIQQEEKSQKLKQIDNEEVDSFSDEKLGSEKRPGWDNKIQYLLAQIAYAVGLGNVWRFPYLCQKNGGGAFLIPYVIMLCVEGVPLFYLELAIGQRLRKGSVGVWKTIHPCLGGVGLASMVVCFLVGLYYNVIICWALFYFFNSFQSPLPWSSCPTMTINNSNLNATVLVHECEISNPTSYFWFRDTLDISDNINEPGYPIWRMVLCLFLAWCIVFLALFKGIKSSGKIIYFSATFPYLVLVIYFFRGVTLDGAAEGLLYMFTPNMSRLLDAEVWRDAATQIFFSLGLGFGGLIAYSSYNDIKNNCKKDAITVSLLNCGTSVFASLVVFSILGFKAHTRTQDCFHANILMINRFAKSNFPQQNLTLCKNENFQTYYDCLFQDVGKLLNDSGNNANYSIFQDWYQLNFKNCSIKEEMKDVEESCYMLFPRSQQTYPPGFVFTLTFSMVVSGPGLAFIAFTEAMIHLPGAPFWSIIFFLMLFNLGLGSMFGTLEGIITPLAEIFEKKISKETVVCVISIVSFFVGIIFTLRSGQYILDIFDTYAATIPLLGIMFFETIAVSWVYGIQRFSEDIKYMIGRKPNYYWLMTWRFISPIFVIVLFFASVVTLAVKTPQYRVYVAEKGIDEKVDYPEWARIAIGLMISLSLIWIPLVGVIQWRELFSPGFSSSWTSNSGTKRRGLKVVSEDNFDDMKQVKTKEIFKVMSSV